MIRKCFIINVAKALLFELLVTVPIIIGTAIDKERATITCSQFQLAEKRCKSIAVRFI